MNMRNLTLQRPSKRVVMAGSLVVSMFAVGAVIGSATGQSSVLAQASDALQNFMGRSPGERSDVDLIKGKIKGARVAGKPGRTVGVPAERALGKVFDTPPEAEVAGNSPLILPQEVLPGAAVPLGQIATGPQTGTGGSPGGGTIGGPGGGFPGGGGGGIIVPPNPTPTPNPTDTPGPGPSPTPTPPDVVTAVPEPGTWLLMLFGFGFYGFAMRKRAGRNIVAASG